MAPVLDPIDGQDAAIRRKVILVEFRGGPANFWQQEHASDGNLRAPIISL